MILTPFADQSEVGSIPPLDSTSNHPCGPSCNMGIRSRSITKGTKYGNRQIQFAISRRFFLTISKDQVSYPRGRCSVLCALCTRIVFFRSTRLSLSIQSSLQRQVSPMPILGVDADWLIEVHNACEPGAKPWTDCCMCCVNATKGQTGACIPSGSIHYAIRCNTREIRWT